MSNEQTQQNKIDKICEWMGWQKIHHTDPRAEIGGWNWYDPHSQESHPIYSSTFNPFTNPADCAVVMEEVVKQKCDIDLKYLHILGRWECEIGIRFELYQGYGTSETGAKMDAVLAMIEAK